MSFESDLEKKVLIDSTAHMITPIQSFFDWFGNSIKCGVGLAFPKFKLEEPIQCYF